MKDFELVELTTHIITEFYQHNLGPYFEYSDEDMLWIGPYDGLTFRGRESLLKNAENEPRDTYFVVNTITSHVVRTSTNTAEVLLQFKVYSSTGQGDMVMHNQHIQFSWVNRQIRDENGQRRLVPRIAVMNVSNLPPVESPETEIGANMIAPPQILFSTTEDGRRVTVTGLDKSTYFFLPATIMYVESCDGGQHSILHIIDRDVICISKINDLVKRYPDIFVKIHESYLVNPGYVCNVKRFEVSIVNGPNLPVPERRFTSVRQELVDFFN